MNFWQRTFIMLFSIGLATTAAAERHALLVGISDYAHVRKLIGPVYDVDKMYDLLTQKWGFNKNNVIRLRNAEATRDAILQNLKQLQKVTRPGDHVLVYLSGHGTSRRDPKAQKEWPLPYTSGAFIPVEFDLEAKLESQAQTLIIGRRDLRPLLQSLDKDRQVLVIVDACYSSESVRALYNRRPLSFRHVAVPSLSQRSTRAGLGDPDLEYGRFSGKKEAYPYNNVYFLAAAGEHEKAIDIRKTDMYLYPTYDGQPHGAFTDALLRILDGVEPADFNADKRLSNGEIYSVVRHFMQKAGYPHTPHALPILEEDHKNLAAREAFADVPTVSVRYQTLRVKLEGMSAAMRAQLGTIEGITWVDEAPHVVVRTEGSQVLVLTSSGDGITKFDEPQPGKIVERLQHLQWVRLIAQPSVSDSFNLELQYSGTRQAGVVRQGEYIKFLIRPERDAQIVLLNMDPEGNVNVLYPFDKSELKMTPADQRLTVGGDTPMDRIEVRNNFGTEYVIALAYVGGAPAELNKLLGKSINRDSPMWKTLEQLLMLPRPPQARSMLHVVSAPAN